MVSEKEKREIILTCLEELIKDQNKIKEFTDVFDQTHNLATLCLGELIVAYTGNDSVKVDYFLDFLSGIRDDLELGADALDNNFVSYETAKYLRGNVLNLLGRIKLSQQAIESQKNNKRHTTRYFFHS